MAHIVCVHVPDQSLVDYRRVQQALGDDPPPGRLGQIAGESDGALHIITVWADQAHADRFTSAALFPAFVRTGLGPGARATFVSFDTDELAVDAPWRVEPAAATPMPTSETRTPSPTHPAMEAPR